MFTFSVLGAFWSLVRMYLFLEKEWHYINFCFVGIILELLYSLMHVYIYMNNNKLFLYSFCFNSVIKNAMRTIFRFNELRGEIRSKLKYSFKFSIQILITINKCVISRLVRLSDSFNVATLLAFFSIYIINIVIVRLTKLDFEKLRKEMPVSSRRKRSRLCFGSKFFNWLILRVTIVWD